MKLLLLRDVPGTGKPGDIVEVKDAFARNFLLPKKLAIPATERDLAAHRAAAEKVQAQTKKKHEQSAADEQRLRGVTVRWPVEANAQGTLFAAVHAAELVGRLATQYGCDLTGVRLTPEHFKQSGTHAGMLHWPSGNTTPLTVLIEGQEKKKAR